MSGSVHELAAQIPSWCDDARQVAGWLTQLSDAAVARTSELTGRGADIDRHQIVVERVCYAATELAVVGELVASLQPSLPPAELALRLVAIGEVGLACRDRLMAVATELELPAAVGAAVSGPEFYAATARLTSSALLAVVGAWVIERGGVVPWPEPELLAEVRQSVRQFATKQVAPLAERLHREDALVPDTLIAAMAELGYFGMSIPEAYGGNEMGNLAMILTTEELSRGSLAGAGSLITRPEILAKALVAGGTEEQKQRWLPQIAAGRKMVAISVTEPDVGSDVASLRCKATPATVGGRTGYILNGAKAWCTFAGRAELVAVLARTEPDASKGAKGLSLFVVEKPPFDGHSFVATQPEGGRLEGTADATPGYRGMHSFSLAFEQWFVPYDALVGGAEGLGKGFYLQMAGFSAGRLQTGGRACGLMQAALEVSARYVTERAQFGATLASYPLTLATVARMAARLVASRALTYRAAGEMDRDERAASTIAAQAKLYACDAAVQLTQMGQVLHGGWGYAEEYAISRHVSDALVLPIFEGVRPILVLKVIARALLGR